MQSISYIKVKIEFSDNKKKLVFFLKNILYVQYVCMPFSSGSWMSHILPTQHVILQKSKLRLTGHISHFSI